MFFGETPLEKVDTVLENITEILTNSTTATATATMIVVSKLVYFIINKVL